MKNFISIFLLLISFQSGAQYTLRLIVNEAATRQNEDFYATGSFNNWNPRDAAYLLKPLGTKRKGVVLKNVPAGKYEFKFTRGTWEKVETTATGKDISNHEVVISGDTSIAVTVEGWKDDYPVKLKPFTASAQVRLVDSVFQIPQLNRTRRIWVYLPKGYATSKKTYPVIYMQDGQNLFNEQTAGFGEWGIDEALDSLQPKTGKEAIIVGIDHGGDKRLVEYNPYDNEKYGKAEGDQYVDFLALTLKPYIDKKYRTKPDVTNTFVAGSSMGALISLYAVMKYPNIYGGVGAFSPSLWIAPQLYEAYQKTNWTTTRPKFFFSAGGQEGTSMARDLKRFVAIVESKQSFAVRNVFAPLSKHDEKAWREEFPGFYRWVLP